MKKIVKIFLILTLILMIGTVAFATDEENLPVNDMARTSDDINLISSELEQLTQMDENIVDNDLYKCEREVTISDTINGNVYVMARDFKLDHAIINGNVFVMAENADFSDVEIYGSVYAICQTINFSGVTNDIYSLSEKLSIMNGSHIWRDVKAMAKDITVDGSIYRNFDYSADKEATILEHAKVETINFHKFEESQTTNPTILDYVKSAINVALRTFVITLILVFIAKKNLKENNLLKDTAKGLGVLILIPIIFVIFLISSIASELGVILIFLYILMLFMGTSFASLAIASKITTENNKLIGFSVLISLAIWVIGLIPYIGTWVQFVAILIGLGTMLPSRNKKVEE